MTEAPTTCPICGKPVQTSRFRPFCSRRCADVDLGRWFGAAYSIPGPPEEDPEADRG
jgi:endogenous inhibitor of DNA gyrase (YacG/DUF329 family)